MVFGYPGRTQEYLTAVEMDQLVNVENARRVEIRDVLLSIMDAEMRANAEVQLKYASKYARIANGWKKWIGQIEGVQFSKGLDRKGIDWRTSTRGSKYDYSKPAAQDSP